MSPVEGVGCGDTGKGKRAGTAPGEGIPALPPPAEKSGFFNVFAATGELLPRPEPTNHPKGMMAPYGLPWQGGELLIRSDRLFHPKGMMAPYGLPWQGGELFPHPVANHL